MNLSLKLMVPHLLLLACYATLDPHGLPDVEVRKPLPQVHRVTIRPASKTPKRQIIHILDWHFVHKEDFTADAQTEAGKADETLTAHRKAGK